MPYKLIENDAYPMSPWFYFLFKGPKDRLPQEKASWNLKYSSTRMAVEEQEVKVFKRPNWPNLNLIPCSFCL